MTGKNHLHTADPVVPEGTDPLDGLLVGELAIIARALKVDPHDALRTWQRWDALAHIGRQWERRRDPRANLEPWTELHVDDLTRLLRLDDLDDDAGDDGDDAGEGVDHPTP